jgi:hypothetical protein
MVLHTVDITREGDREGEGGTEGGCFYGEARERKERKKDGWLRTHT